MATEQSEGPPINVMELLTRRFREVYQEKHGEEPPEELVEKFQRRALLTAAKEDRDRNRELYDELAKE